jgi:hypothetical protein
LLNVYGGQTVDVSTGRRWVVRFRGGDSDVRRIFGPERDEVTGGGENCVTRSFVI